MADPTYYATVSEPSPGAWLAQVSECQGGATVACISEQFPSQDKALAALSGLGALLRERAYYGPLTTVRAGRKVVE